MEDKSWVLPAFRGAADAATQPRSRRARWKRQNQWDRENMRTESTRFTVEEDRRLRRCCREAHVNRSHLIAFMLRAWMESWEAAHDGR